MQNATSNLTGFLLLLLVAFPVAAQTEAPASPSKTYEYQIVDQPPVFPGGMPALQQFIAEHLRPLGIPSGKYKAVFVGFTVCEDGSLTDLQVLRGIDQSFDKEALRVVGLLPNWTPGKLKGTSVRVRYALPIKFAASKDE